MDLEKMTAESTKFIHAVQAIPGLLEAFVIVFALGFIVTVLAVLYLASRVHHLVDAIERQQHRAPATQPQDYLTPFHPPRA